VTWSECPLPLLRTEKQEIATCFARRRIVSKDSGQNEFSSERTCLRGNHFYRRIAILDGTSDALHDLPRLVWKGISAHWDIRRLLCPIYGTASPARRDRIRLWSCSERAVLASSGFDCVLCIRLGNVQVHKDRMIRTYVLACAGIVGDRIIPDMTFVARRIRVDALNDISGWANWAVPLMVVEVVMQIRRLRKMHRPHKISLPAPCQWTRNKSSQLCLPSFQPLRPRLATA
jgi:hypothetical protein